jgi:hypothetical protein
MPYALCVTVLPFPCIWTSRLSVAFRISKHTPIFVLVFSNVLISNGEFHWLLNLCTMQTPNTRAKI